MLRDLISLSLVKEIANYLIGQAKSASHSHVITALSKNAINAIGGDVNVLGSSRFFENAHDS